MVMIIMQNLLPRAACPIQMLCDYEMGTNLENEYQIHSKIADSLICICKN